MKKFSVFFILMMIAPLSKTMQRRTVELPLAQPLGKTITQLTAASMGLFTLFYCSHFAYLVSSGQCKSKNACYVFPVGMSFSALISAVSFKITQEETVRNSAVPLQKVVAWLGKSVSLKSCPRRKWNSLFGLLENHNPRLAVKLKTSLNDLNQIDDKIILIKKGVLADLNRHLPIEISYRICQQALSELAKERKEKMMIVVTESELKSLMQVQGTISQILVHQVLNSDNTWQTYSATIKSSASPEYSNELTNAYVRLRYPSLLWQDKP